MVTHAGLLALAFSMVGLLATFILRPPSLLAISVPGRPIDPIVATQLALLTICGYGVIGAMDDRHSLSHLVHVVGPLTLALPAAVLTLSRPESVLGLVLFPALQPIATVSLLIVVALYILVVTNLINMHSGYNGLQSGLCLILLGTLIVRVTLDGKLEGNLVLFLIAGGAAALYPFNRYPARAIEGNVGSFLFGSAIGVAIVTNGLFISGIVMLAPHIFDFLLFLYAKARGLPFIKYGRVRPDGTIEAPYPFKLKFLLPFYFHLTERQTVRILYGITALASAFSFAVNF